MPSVKGSTDTAQRIWETYTKSKLFRWTQRESTKRFLNSDRQERVVRTVPTAAELAVKKPEWKCLLGPVRHEAGRHRVMSISKAELEEADKKKDGGLPWNRSRLRTPPFTNPRQPMNNPEDNMFKTGMKTEKQLGWNDYAAYNLQKESSKERVPKQKSPPCRRPNGSR